ncbi:hypothetical protein NB311A_07223 [Nitrobacter sp. Nb-311A]|uniref:DUF927 domain-containing protein n=1 Tax=Nitrobacter sp. Nb-311A TaxID=314253 RepID=UPI0000684C5A|nr:DUF927 domain-containing protein [Nitrobacter sp. Nb-311A]EAQ36921.1 hypothetical protein NB311A_07223 [Nitrobacter sp. Nb-311A]
MGAVNQAFEHSGRIDFAAVSHAARVALTSLVQDWLPDGRREGSEWISRNPTRGNTRPGSFKINLSTGVWSDFATGEAGGDAIDLLAYLNRTSKLDAAREIAQRLGVTGGTASIPRTAQATKPTPSPIDLNAAPTFPARTSPDQDGKPRFVIAGDEGPRIRDDEKRRHVYRVGGVPVRIKIMRKDGNAMNVYRVTDTDGTTGWQYRKPKGFAAVPYFTGRNPFEGEQDQFIYWPEGEKDVDTLAKLGLPAFTFGGCGDGLPSGCEQYLTGRNVVILADNDDEGRNHADKKAALAFPVAVSVRVVHFDDVPKKGDVSDWIEAGHTADDLRARVDAAPQWTPPADEAGSESGTTVLPFGYKFTERGLMWLNPDDDEKPPMQIAGHFDILAETRDGEGGSWGLLLHWKDHDGREHRYALPRAMLAGDGSEARRALLDGGMFIAPSAKARTQFNSFLLQVRSPNRARATQRVGWHGNSFVLPDDCFGADQRDMLLLQSATAHEHSFRQKGTLQDWQDNVARYAIGNSRLVVALSAAFAGPLIGPCSAEGGGLHFRGASSTGKSTALLVAGSVWGGGEVTGFVRSWRATANGLEGVALGHSDTLLCLDELSQLAAKDAGEAAYMLGNGSGKSRSSRDGSARRAAKWRVMFLSSGEISLADKVAEDGRGRRLAAGQQVRIVDIPADAGAGMGLFENLHGFDSAEALARHLRAATMQNYGVAAREYLAAVVSNIDVLRKQVSELVRAFCEQFVPAGADGQVERVAQRFGLVAAGGEIAVRCGVVPWQRGEATLAAGRCFEDWLAVRGGIEPAEAREGIDQVRSFLLANGMARFIPAWEDDQDKRIQPRDVAGYRQKVGDGWDYFITTTAWKEEVCRGLDARRVAATLEQKGGLLCDTKTHRTNVCRVPGHGRLRLYHVPARFLEADHDA